MGETIDATLMLLDGETRAWGRRWVVVGDGVLSWAAWNKLIPTPDAADVCLLEASVLE